MPANARYLTARQQWAVAFYQHHARWQVTEGIKSKQDADDLAKAANKRMQAGEDLRPADKRPKPAVLPTAAEVPTEAIDFQFRRFASRWLVEEAPLHKATSVAFYDTQLTNHLYPAIGDQDIRDIDRGVVKQLLRNMIGKVSDRTGRTIGNLTREAVHSTLCVVLEAAVDRQLIPHNPALRLKKKHMHDPDQLDREIAVWTPAQVEAFLAVCLTHAPRWYPFFFFALRTGLRIGELVELRWEKDFEHPGKVLVQRGYSFKKRWKFLLGPDGGHYKEAIPGQDRITTTKGKRKRMVDLFPPVQQVLDDHRKAQRVEAFQRGQGGKIPALVFLSDRGMRVSDVTLRRLMITLAEIAKVPLLTIHGLRHTYASVNLARGEDLHYVSGQLGHADVATTERHYKAFIPDDAAMMSLRTKRHLAVWSVGESAAQ